MYLEHFGLNEPPFRITPHTDFFFEGANRGATLDALVYAITHDEGIVKVSGEVGSGKTMLCRVLMERLPDRVTIIYLANPSLSRDDILYAIADELRLDIPDNARSSVVMRALHDHLIKSYGEGRQVVVLIDEAHAMPTETLEEIRLLSNLETNHSKLLQLVLFGQPELNDILARPDMRQLKERITHNFGLEPLVREDISHYLDFRMRAAGYRGPSVFAPPALKLIEQSSLGLTRRINILADKALLAAFSAGSHQIGTKETQAAIRDCEFSDATYGGGRARGRTRSLWIVIALTILILAGATWLILSRTETGVPAMPAAAPAAPASAATATPPAGAEPAAPPQPAGRQRPHSQMPHHPLRQKVRHLDRHLRLPHSPHCRPRQSRRPPHSRPAARPTPWPRHQPTHQRLPRVPRPRRLLQLRRHPAQRRKSTLLRRRRNK
jgi:MSHA biogenesis protein MshM